MDRFDPDDMVAGISRWAGCESPTSDRAAVNRMMDVVAADLAAGGLASERVPGRDGFGDVLVVRAGPANGKKPAIVLSHMDTVHPIGTLERDLPLRVEGDRLYGPGVLDMKGGAYMGLRALCDVSARQSSPRPIVYLFTPDEEVGSPSTRALIEDVSREAEYVLVTEPARAGGKVVTARRGSARYDVSLQGRPAHSGSAHEAGRSAIREAAHQILDVEARNDPARGINANVGLMRGGSAANTVPEHAWFKVDFRMTHPGDAEMLDEWIRRLSPRDPDVRIRVEGRINRPPYAKSAVIAGLHRKVQAVGADLGLALDDVPLAGGGSDGNFSAAMGVPTLDGLGIEGSGGHTLEEYGLISSIPVRTTLLVRLLETL